MKVLGIDTSSYANAVGVVSGGVAVADAVFPARTDSLEKIVARIDEVLRSCAMELKELDGIGVGLGPGSWTGIRVGITVGKILAYSAGKAIAGIPTLDALACAAGDSSLQICAVINAGAGETVYAAFYRAAGGSVTRVGEYYVGDTAGLAPLIAEPVLVVSPEAERYARMLGEKVSTLLSAVTEVPRGAAVASLAAGRLEKGESDDALALAPLYLKESTARAFTGRYAKGRGEKAR